MLGRAQPRWYRCDIVTSMWLNIALNSLTKNQSFFGRSLGEGLTYTASTELRWMQQAMPLPLLNLDV
jgi:hypothetical protein